MSMMKKLYVTKKRLAKFFLLLREFGLFAALSVALDYFKSQPAAPHSGGRRSGFFPPDVTVLQEAIDLKAVCVTPAAEKLSIAIVLHVFYPRLLPEMIPYLRHIPCSADVYVSTDTEEKAADITAQISPLSFASLDIRVLPNKGWDIAPFLLGFKDVLLKYDLILKLHTKASSHQPPEYSRSWRELIFSTLCSSRERAMRILSLFAASPRLGMLVPPWPGIAHVPEQGLSRTHMCRLLGKYNIRLPVDAAVDFPAGSMFWCRPEILTPWLEAGLTFDDFAKPHDLLRDGTLAHALERLFLFGCGMKGLSWARVEAI